MLQLARVSSPLGEIVVTVRSGALCALRFSDRPAGDGGPRFGQAPHETARDPGGVVSALRAYFAGRLDALEGIPVDPKGTPFQLAVWRALRAIPPGRVRSYRELALAIGAPKAVRAVGAANGANPISIVVPCHRVIGSDGRLVGYGGGLERKRWLLRHEGVLLT